jgi:hypothetical protein
MRNPSTPRAAAALVFTLAATLAAIGLFVAFRDTSAVRALAAPAAEPAFTNDNFNAPGLIMQPPSPPDAAILPWDGSQTTVGATLEPGETAPCGPIGSTVWFYYQPDHTGTLEISTAGSDFDTVLAVYTMGNGFLPSPPGANLNAVACNDDAGGATSLVSFPLTRYEHYYIQAGGKDGAAGNLHLHLRCNPACPPSNDDFTAAADLYVDSWNPVQESRVDTTHATLEAAEPRPCGDMGATVWYTFYAGQDVNLIVDTQASSFDTALAVYTFDYQEGGAADHPGALTLVGCNDNSTGTQSRLAFHAKGNAQYWFQVGGAGGATGALTVLLSCDPDCPPYNDGFNNSAGLNPPAEEESRTTAATLEQGEPQPCGNIGRTVWYAVYVYGNVSLVVDTAGSDFDTVAAVYTTGPEFDGTMATLQNVACVDNSGGPQARVKFDATHGNTYHVQVGGHNGASGTLHLSVDCDPSPCPPPNDSAASPMWASVPDYLPFGSSFDTRGATTDAGEPLDCGNMGRTVWYALTSSVHATVAFDTSGSDFDAAIAVYGQTEAFSPPGGSSQRIACGAGNNGRVQFEVQPNTTVYLQVGGVGGAGGNLQVHGDCIPACPPRNDNIASAFDFGWSFVDERDTRGATLEQNEPRPCGDIGATVWYRVSLVREARIDVDTSGSDFSPVVALYRLEGVSPPGGLALVACHDGGGAVSFQVEAGGGYVMQIGGFAGASGHLRVQQNCVGAGCPPGLVGPDTGGPVPGSGGGIVALPETGNGGYLPGSH